MAGRVLLEIVYLLVRRALGFAVLVFRRDLSKDAELLALRHENAVPRRIVMPPLTRAGRMCTVFRLRSPQYYAQRAGPA